MQITLPRPEFALCKIAKRSLYRLHDGRLVAHRPAHETRRENMPFKHPEVFLDWPSSSDDIPEKTRREFAAVAAEMSGGLT
jgi:hypothetical protein